MFIACSMSYASAPRDLSNDDPVGAHAKRVGLIKIPLANLAAPFDVGRSRLPTKPRWRVRLEFGGVFDGDDTLARVDRARESVEKRRFAGACAAGNGDMSKRECTQISRKPASSDEECAAGDEGAARSP